METAAGFDYAMTDCTNSHTTIIDLILNPSCSLPSSFLDGRHAFHVKTQIALHDTAPLVSEISVFDKYHVTCLAYAMFM